MSAMLGSLESSICLLHLCLYYRSYKQSGHVEPTTTAMSHFFAGWTHQALVATVLRGRCHATGVEEVMELQATVAQDLLELLPA